MGGGKIEERQSYHKNYYGSTCIFADYIYNNQCVFSENRAK